jgi:RNA polymerase sigma-70 factor (ECF subfamily)
MDTSDLVQVSMIRGLERISMVREKRKGSFFVYLRHILINQVRDEIRRIARRPRSEIQSDEMATGNPDPLDELIGQEVFEQFQSAVSRLPPHQQEALALRIGWGYSYQEIADAIGCPSSNAARMMVSRALAFVAGRLRRSYGESDGFPGVERD